MHFYDQLLADTTAERDQLLATPIIRRGLTGDVSLPEYRGFLSQAYHHVSHTVPLLMACGARLPERFGWMRAAVARYIEEEIGHDEWILDDIEAAGGDPEAVRSARPLPATELMLSYAYDTVNRGHPAGLFGMVLVLEGTSVSLAHRAADAIQQHLSLPDSAFRYLTSHGSVDQDHIVFLEELMNRLDDDESRQAVIHAARMFYGLYGDIFRSIH